MQANPHPRRWRRRMLIFLGLVGALIAGVIGLFLALATVMHTLWGPTWVQETFSRMDRPRVTGFSGLRLLVPAGVEGQPRWSPDSKLIGYMSFDSLPPPPQDTGRGAG